MIHGRKRHIRDAVESDLPAVLELNEAGVPNVNRVSPDTVRWFLGNAVYFRVAVEQAAVAGFVTALGSDADYLSVNFRWFKERYERFVYIDRIVVAGWARRRGIARRMYEDLEAFSRPVAPLLACEVNTRPRNEVSLGFHERFGFRKVGSQDTEQGAKTVRLMIKRLDPPGRP